MIFLIKIAKIKKDKVIGFAEEFLIQKDRYNEKMKNIENLKGQVKINFRTISRNLSRLKNSNYKMR